MRIACLQFNPSLGKFPQNVERAEALLEGAQPGAWDLLMLPELAFTGYNFPSLEAIAPHLEPTASGPSTEWAVRTSRRLQCHVSVGYPEIAATANAPTKTAAVAAATMAATRYNAVVLVSPAGEVLANYRKSHLYYTDETWAHEGKDGFFVGDTSGLGRITMGICMDINPYRFEAPWTAYEFFSHAVLKSASVILLTMAWLTTDAEPCPPEQAAVPDIHTLEYWLKRLHPLIAAAKDGRQHDEEVLVALCNRCGSEDGGAHYAGTTTVLGIPGGGDAVTLYGVLGRGEEKLLVVDTADAPHAQRLVLRETDTA